MTKRDLTHSRSKDTRRKAIWLRFAALLIASWCVMATTHEFGHIAVGLATGGILVDYEIAPWHLPHSTFQPNPHPLITLWGGPILGVALPLIGAALFRIPSVWFVANFCLLANGTYLALAWASGDSHLDTARLLNAGASPTTIAIYCVSTITCGYAGFRRDCINALGPLATSPSATAERPSSIP